jgi:hypothetical protein
VIREDGGISLTCGKGTATLRGATTVIVMLVLGLTYSVAALAGRLADEHAGYQGQWRLGVRMDRLRGAVPLDTLQDALRKPGSPYTRDEYERTTSASTEELVNAPYAVAERLVAPLLRGLGIAPLYLPYKP